jgi:hypothetical protein
MSKRSFREFAKSAVECLYDLEAIGISKENAISSVENEIEDLLKLNDKNTLKGRHEHFSIPGTQMEDYEENFYELSAGKNVLAGIRHKSGMKGQPFVHMLLDFVPTSAEIELLRQFASKQFHKFNPKFLSIWLRPSLELDVSTYEATQSRQYVVGSIARIRKMGKPFGYDRIILEKVIADFDFKWYSEAYEDFHRQQPELKDWVPITDREDIDRCLSDQLLYKVFVDDVLAGLIGAQNEPLLEKPSVYMAELLLISKFKGQGLAVALQRKFIDELPKNFDLVWGTIDAKNLPSLKTALRVGRFLIRSEYFIRLV